MPTKLLSILLLLLSAFSACKDPQEDETSYPGPRIKKMSQYYQGNLVEEITYHYDLTGRVIKENRSGHESIVYSYLPGKLVMKVYLPNSTEDVPVDTMLLNDNGMQTSTYPSTTIKYDEYGYLVEMTLLINNIPNSHTFIIKDGNTVQWTLWTGNKLENIAYKHLYEFLPNSANTIGDENMGMPFYGKQDENLVSKAVTILYHAGGTSKSTITYQYELDAFNRVVKRSIVEQPGNYTVYTYY